jgi:hypothetical protein
MNPSILIKLRKKIEFGLRARLNSFLSTFKIFPLYHPPSSFLTKDENIFPPYTKGIFFPIIFPLARQICPIFMEKLSKKPMVIYTIYPYIQKNWIVLVESTPRIPGGNRCDPSLIQFITECQLHLTSLKQRVIMLILNIFSIYKDNKNKCLIIQLGFKLAAHLFLSSY